MTLTPTQTAELLEQTLQYARLRNYTGYDYFDGMSSGVLQAIPIESKWLNILVQEGIKRSPVNVRPLFLVEQRQNFKGSALFAIANTTAYERSGNDLYKREATSLADWLVEHQNNQFTGFCGGHRHEMQQLRERRPANTPNIVTTSYAVKALLRVSTLDVDHLATAESAAQFIDDALEYHTVDKGALIKYHPLENGDYVTINGVAVGARLLVDLYDYLGDTQYLEQATKLLDYVVTHQTDLGGWMYREPASASHLSMDNHHNGFIIEALLRYKEVADSDRYEEELDQALTFYKQTLFESDGAPNWDEHNRFPKDIHAAAQGIILFSMAGDTDFAGRILQWTLENLYGGHGQFYYQKRRYYTKRFTLMRWCQAWMAYALACYLAAISPPEQEVMVA